MKPGWTEATLGEVLAQDRNYVRALESRTYKKLSVKLYGKGVSLDASVHGDEVKMEKHQFARSGQIIVSEIWAKKGALGIVPPEGNGALITSHFFLFNIASPSLSPAWMKWMLRGNYLERQLSAGAFGTTGYASVRPSKFLEATIPLPPLAEQQRLAARLDAIETRLTRVRHLREEQTQKLQSALRTTFHRLVESAEWKPLSEVAPLAWRQIAIEPETSYTEFGVRSFYKGVFLRRKVPGSFFDWQELYRLKAGDIVFSNIMAWEKAIAVAGPEHDDWVGNHRMLICEPREDVVLASCLLHYFMTEEGFAKILKASPGTAARNKTLKADHLMAIEVPVPPLAAQREFQKLLTLQTQVLARAAESEAATTALLPSLLDHIFN